MTDTQPASETLYTQQTIKNEQRLRNILISYEANVTNLLMADDDFIFFFAAQLCQCHQFGAQTLRPAEADVYVQFSANSDVYCPVVMARSQKR